MDMKNTKSIPAPTIGVSYGFGWSQMKKYFLNLLFITLIMLAAQSITSLGNAGENPSFFAQLFTAAYGLFVLSVIDFGSAYMFLKAVRDEPFEVSEIFDGFKTNFGNIVLSNLLMFLIIGLGFVLLIVPGIILACRLAFVPYLVMDKNMDAVEALKKSWEMTKGHGWTIFFMALLAVLIIIAGFIVFIVGVIFAVMWITAAFAALYYAVESNGNQDAETVTTV